MQDFHGQVVLIPGGTGNLGAAGARAFAAAGARVALLDRDADKQRGLFPDWIDSPDHALAAPVDLMDPDDTAGVVAKLGARYGRIDVLVNTVGGYRAGDPVHELDLATWDLMLNLNARTTLITCRAVLPTLLAQGRGKIINVAARAGLSGSANHAAYAASKAAVIRITESMSAEVKAQGVNVNCVLPGTIDTEDNRAAMPKADRSRWVTPQSLAEVIGFLASDAARDIHGAAIPVAGLG